MNDIKKIQMENGVENGLYVVDGLFGVGRSRKPSVEFTWMNDFCILRRELSYFFGIPNRRTSIYKET